jgi:hypothetical protein
MKASELLPQLGAALESNSVCTELNLAGCNVDDHTIEGLTQALQVNSSLTSLSLEANKINNDGAIQIARALKANRSLLELNLLNQKGTRFGDTTLGEFITGLTLPLTLTLTRTLTLTLPLTLTLALALALTRRVHLGSRAVERDAAQDRVAAREPPVLPAD